MMCTGFVKAASNNLPTVNMFMVTEFIKSDERFNAAEFRGVKASASAREQYGDNAVGFVELKRAGSVCTLQCKICPEHRIKSKNYNVIMSIDEDEEKILNVECKDCAASAGGCKHALAFIMWAYRRSEEPSPTDIKSYWTKPVLAGVHTSLKFVTTADFQSTAMDASLSLPSSSSSFRGDLLATVQNIPTSSLIFRYNSNITEDKWSALCIYQSMLLFHKEGGSHVDDYLLFILSKTTASLCNEGEQLTRQQKDSPMWHRLRFGRITASKLFEFTRCTTSQGTLIEQILGSYKIKQTKFMKRGLTLEKEVLFYVQKQLSLQFEECGFFILPHFAIFGASPDAISSEFIVEIKCPSSNKAMATYIKDGDITPKFRAQMQLQMLCSGRKLGYFCVAAPDFEISKNVNILEIEYDDAMINDMLQKAELNWKQFIFPKIYNSVV